jgi:Sec-independent protein secretion pathway component TatC
MADTLDTILALTPMALFYAGVLWASAWIAPKTKEKEPGE